MMPDYLHVVCYRDVARDSNNTPIPGPMTKEVGWINLPITHASILSEPLPRGVTFISIIPTVDCCVAFSRGPGHYVEADPGYHWVEAGERLFYGVHPQSRVAVIEYHG